jgi:hypothetical protein
MKSDTVLKSEGMNILIKNLGEVDAERFISLLIKEPFDYTKWQEGLMEDLSVREVSKNAMEYRSNIK